MHQVISWSGIAQLYCGVCKQKAKCLFRHDERGKGVYSCTGCGCRLVGPPSK